MMKWLFFTAVSSFILVLGQAQTGNFEQDTFSTSQGELKITFIGHGTLMFEFAGKVIHVDPVSSMADYNQLPKADIIFVTHEHGDHLDPQAIQALSQEKTSLVITERCAEKASQGIIMKNGQTTTIQGIKIEAVPAYNLVHMRREGNPFHPKGQGNGYILTLGDKRIYVAGDTEDIPEMMALRGIDIVFLPMNLPYTMTPEMVARAARAFKPKVLYPYHYGNTDTPAIINLLQDEKEIEVRIRQLK